MFKGYKYKLNQEEQQLAIDTGAARTARAKGAKLAHSKLAERQSQVFIDQNGAAGEIAFAAMLLDHDLYTKEQYEAALKDIREAGITSAYQNLDDGDLVWEGLKIDVKTTEYADGGLWLTNNKRYARKLDGYVLITGSSDDDWTYTFRGYRTSSWCLNNWEYKVFNPQRKAERWKPAYFNQDELLDLPSKHHKLYMDLLNLDEPMDSVRFVSDNLTLASEKAYIRNIVEREDPRVEAEFVKELGEQSSFWDQWFEACSGHYEDARDFLNVIDMVADQLWDDLCIQEAFLDDLIKMRKEEGNNDRRDAQLELMFED